MSDILFKDFSDISMRMLSRMFLLSIKYYRDNFDFNKKLNRAVFVTGCLGYVWVNTCQWAAVDSVEPQQLKPENQVFFSKTKLLI